MKITSILTVASCAGAIAIAVCASKDSKKAQKRLAETEITTEQGTIRWNTKEKAKIVWKDYIPTGIAIGGTIGCIIASHRLNAKQIAALGATVAGLRTAYYKYGDKVKQFVGKEKANEIREMLNKDRAEEKLKKVDISKIKPRKKPKKNQELAYYYEPITDQYIYTTGEQIVNGIEKMDAQLQEKGYFEVNDLMDAIGGYVIDYCQDEHGEDLVFVIDDGNTHSPESENWYGFFGVSRIALDKITELEHPDISTDKPVYMINYDIDSEGDFVPDELDPHFDEILDPHPKLMKETRETRPLEEAEPTRKN